jgi:hypothetical protein
MAPLTATMTLVISDSYGATPAADKTAFRAFSVILQVIGVVFMDNDCQ